MKPCQTNDERAPRCTDPACVLCALPEPLPPAGWCSFDPERNGCECRSGGLTLEERKDCHYWQANAEPLHMGGMADACITTPAQARVAAEAFRHPPAPPVWGGIGSAPFTPPRPACGVRKPGWYCSREEGHEGPCAAWPISHDAMPDAWVENYRPRWWHWLLLAVGQVVVAYAIAHVIPSRWLFLL